MINQISGKIRFRQFLVYSWDHMLSIQTIFHMEAVCQKSAMVYDLSAFFELI